MNDPNQCPSIKKLSKESWYALINEWESSNLSQQAFCRQKQVNYNTFTY